MWATPPPPCDPLLIERERHHVFAPSLLRLMVGQRTPRAFTRPLGHLELKGIDVLVGEIEHIDPGQ